MGIIRRRRYSLFHLIGGITILCIASALWLAPVQVRFELDSAHRTSCNQGDLIDIQDKELQTIVSKAEVVNVERIHGLSEPVDVVTVRTSLINRIRMLFYDDFRAVYYPTSKENDR